MSTSEEKRAKAEARKARLLAKGNDRLARITGSGRPGEDAALYTQHPPSTPRASGALASEDVSDPGEVDISRSWSAAGGSGDESLRSSRVFGDSFVGDTSSFMPTPSMFDTITPTAGGGGAGGTESPQFPFPLPQMDAANPLQQLLNFANGTSSGPPRPKERPTLGRVAYELVHFLLVAALGLYAAMVLEPVSALVVGEEGNMKRWKGLRWERPSVGLEGAVGKVPMLAMFATLEVVLQSTRYYMNRNQFAPPTLLAAITPHLPPQLAVALNTGGRYWTLLSGVLDDLAVLVFIVGFFMMWGNIFS
ncbi:hypothetical protein BT69DRAFT_1319037 [Atractiella rhizophila]|nr:hypothetical protein BT69DRAFT_1319037 [Atractiella rhizophila]